MYAGSTIVGTMQAWMVFLAVWVCNNSYWNVRHVSLMQKVLTLILVFKTLGVYASFSLYMSCPFDRVSYGLLQLVQNQFRTLYETSYLCLLLVLSKGLFLIRSEFTRAEFNHISILASIIYVTVSAYNIMGDQISVMVFCMYLTLWVHCTYFSYLAYRIILERIRLAESTQVADMSRAWFIKRRMFCMFCAATQVYFAGELVIHMGISDWSFGLVHSTYDVNAINVGVHEALEVLVLGAIFFVYRAKPQGRFFTLLNDGGVFPRQTLEYSTDMFKPVSRLPPEVTVTSPVVIVNPGLEWDRHYPFEKVTLGIVVPTPPRTNKRVRTALEVTENRR